jgi:hypothetical protein
MLARFTDLTRGRRATIPPPMTGDGPRGGATRRLRRVGGIVSCAVLVACGPRVEVRAERSTIATFPRYRTYVWAASVVPARSPGEMDASLLDRRIRDAVDRRLAAKGYVRTEGTGTLVVDYDVRTRTGSTDSFSDYFRYRRLGGANEAEVAYVSGFEEGTLVVQLVDPRSREVAYRASATTVVDERVDRERLDDAIGRMFADLPVAEAGSR